MEEISISNAIKITSGTCKYQNLLLFACGLLLFACSVSINSLPLMFSPLYGDSNATTSFQLIESREWLRRHLPKQFYIGIVFSAIPGSLLIDKFGRKSIIRSFTPYYLVLCIFSPLSVSRNFLGSALLMQGIMFFVLVSAALMLVTESVYLKFKSLYLLCLAMCYVLGHLYCNLMFLLGVNWRVTYGSSFFFGLLSYYLLSKTQESAEWVLSTGRTLEVKEIIKAISIINNTSTLGEKIIVANNPPNSSTYQLLRKHKQKCIIFSILWLCLIMSCTAVYYSPVKLSDNIYNNYLSYFTIHIASLLVIWLLKNQQNCIKILFSVLLLSRVGLILLSLCDPLITNYWLSSSLIIIVRLSLDIEMFYIANLTLQVFGADMRGLGFGLCITFGAIGGFLVFGYPSYSYIIGAHVDVCAGIFSFLSLFVSLFIGRNRKWKKKLREIGGGRKEFMLLEMKS